jgi:phosphoribosylaminoimidazole-succinocarboxamide synthase
LIYQGTSGISINLLTIGAVNTLKEAYMVDDPLAKGKVEVVRHSDAVKGVEPRRGKVRDVYDLGKEMLIVTTDRISAYDVVFPTLIPHKGESINRLAEFWFNKTKKVIPNHFIKVEDERSMRVRKAKRIDIEFVCRSYLYGSAWRSYRDGARTVSGVKLPDGLRMAEKLPEVILTPTTKAEAGHDMEISGKEAIDEKLVNKDEWAKLEEATLKLFTAYQSHAKSRGFIIPDFKLEFGRLDGELIQIDEPPSHDSARFWAEKFYEPGKPQEAHCLDKEFLRAYLREVGYMGDGPAPEIPTPVVKQVAMRCVASYEVLSGKKTLSDFGLKNVDQVMRELG